MDVSRRSFLGGALTIAAASLVPVAAAKALGMDDVPTLWGDGVHDDWAGLQALIGGRPYRIAGSDFMVRSGDDSFELQGGNFLVSRTLTFPDNGRRGLMRDLHITTTPDFGKNDAVLHFESGHAPTKLRNLHFTGSAEPASDYVYHHTAHSKP